MCAAPHVSPLTISSLLTHPHRFKVPAAAETEPSTFLLCLLAAGVIGSFTLNGMSMEKLSSKEAVFGEVRLLDRSTDRRVPGVTLDRRRQKMCTEAAAIVCWGGVYDDSTINKREG